MKKTTILSLLSIAGTIIFSGCDSFDYSGQNFPETPEETAIKIYWKDSEVDHDNLRIIGKGIYIASDSLDQFDIEENLADFARKHGADAVSVVKVQNIVQGLYERNEPVFEKAVKEETPETVETKKPVTKKKENVLGEKIQLKGEEHGVSKREIFVFFLKNKQEADKILSERDQKLEKKIEGNWNDRN